MYILIQERDAINTIHTLWLHIEHLLDRKIVLSRRYKNRKEQNRKETGRAGKGRVQVSLKH